MEININPKRSSDIHLTPRMREILVIGLKYLHANLDDVNDIIVSTNEVVDQVLGITLRGSISGKEVEELRQQLEG